MTWLLSPSCPDYEVSEDGRVRRATPHVLNTRWPVGHELRRVKNHAGYLRVEVYVGGRKVGKRVSRLVAEAFLGPCPEGREVNHKNGNKSDDRPENLEYVTRGENIRHAFRTGLLVRAKGEKSPNAKLTNKQAQEIRKRYVPRRVSQRQLAREYGVSQAIIGRVVNGISYPA